MEIIKERVFEFINLIHSPKALSLLFVLLLIAAIPLITYVVQQQHDIRSKAAVTSNPKSPDVEKPEYVAGEVLVKLRTQMTNVKTKEGKSVDLNKESVAISEVGEESIPSILTAFNQKYKIKTVEKVFKGAEDPQKELNKIKSKFSKEISEGKRKINEQEFLKIDLSRTYKLSFDKGISVEEVIQQLSFFPEIEYAEPNYIFKTQLVPNDPYYLDSYPNNVGNRDPNWNPPYDYQWNLKKIGMEGAWNIATGSSQVVVAVVDTGVDYTHPELGGCTSDQVNNNQCSHVAPGYNFVNNDNNPMDDNGHGTHVGGIITTITNNQVGIAGTAWNVKVLPVKVLDQNGSGGVDIVSSGIVYSANYGAKIANLSLANSIPIQPIPSTLDNALKFASSVGSVLVAAAGNRNMDISEGIWPANHPKVVSVSAIDYMDNKASFSNYGQEVDITAPGMGILSLRARDTDMYCPQSCNTHIVSNNYYWADGTSMAAPHVSAVVAMIFKTHTDLIGQDIKRAENILLNGVDDIGNPGFDTHFGYGRVSALNSLANPDITTPPIARITSPPTNSLLKAGSTIDIWGLAHAPNFIGYKLEYYPENDPSNIQLILQSNQAILSNEILTSWTLPETEGVLILKLTVSYFDRNNIEKEISISVKIRTDYLIREGWPINLPDPAGYGGLVPLSIGADIDGDGEYEVLINYINTLYVIDGDGKILWKKPIKDSLENVSFYTPVVGDIDPDYAGNEIIIYVDGLTINGSYTRGLMAWHNDGTAVDGWPVIVGPPYRLSGPFSPAIAKGTNGYYVVHNDFFASRVKIFNGSGNLIREIFLPGGDNGPRPFGFPRAGDLDGDGDEDIVVHGSREGMNEVLFAYTLEGDSLWSSPKPYYETNTFGIFALADINLDGKAEVIVARQTGVQQEVTFKIYIYTSNGNTLDGWGPRDMTGEFLRFYDNVLNIFVNIADVDFDSIPDIVVSVPTSWSRWQGDYYYKMVINSYGRVLQGFPDNSQPPENFTGQAVGEIGRNIKSKGFISNGNKMNGSLFETFVTVGKYDRDNSFSMVTGFPKNICQFCEVSWQPMFLNLDHESQSLISIVGSYYSNGLYVYAFNIPDSEGSNFIDWPQYLHDERHTGTYIRPVSSPTPTPTPTPIPTPIPCTVCRADIDQDGLVRIVDFSRLSACFNKSALENDSSGRPCAPSDLDGNGRVEMNDFSCLQSKFGQRCQ